MMSMSRPADIPRRAAGNRSRTNGNRRPESPRPVLMSFRPQWAASVLDNGTRWELRRTRCGCAPGTPVLVYESGNTRALSGVFAAGEVLAEHPYNLYPMVGGDCGVDWDGFAEYLAGLETAYAIEVREPRRIPPVPLGFRGPMSWRYLDGSEPAHARLLNAAGM